MDDIVSVLIRRLKSDREVFDAVDRIEGEDNAIGLEWNGELYFITVMPA